MVRGRKPTPNVIKIARGNPGKRPLNENEPPAKEVTRIPTLPVSLKGNKIGAKQWRLLARKLIDMNVLGDVDLMALEQLCSWYAHWHKAEAALQREDDVVKARRGNFMQQQFSVARRSSEMMLRFMSELGLTPSSRSRVDLRKANGQGDDLFE